MLFFLKEMYSTLYPSIEESNLFVCNTCRSAKYVDIFGSVLGVKLGRSSRSSMIIAYWHKDNGNICTYDDMELAPRPGQKYKNLLYTML